jgi:DNA-binding GntR family transcriptional regulator
MVPITNLQDPSPKGALKKKNLTALTVADLPKEKPDLNHKKIARFQHIAEWMSEWISNGLQDKTLSDKHLLPNKYAIAKYLEVSVGTIQNAIRYIEDQGFVESKKCFGTLIRPSNKPNRLFYKSENQRDRAVKVIKKFIVDNDYLTGEFLPSARHLSLSLQIKLSTLNLALNFLDTSEILENRGKRGNKLNWRIKRIPTLGNESDETSTKLADDIKQFIKKEYQCGDKIPSTCKLAESFMVSQRSICIAMAQLTREGVIHRMRGRYGTFVTSKEVHPPTYLHSTAYEQLLTIISEQEPGSKLPNTEALAQRINQSYTTTQRALQAITTQGSIASKKGKYGGRFVKE